MCFISNTNICLPTSRARNSEGEDKKRINEKCWMTWMSLPSPVKTSACASFGLVLFFVLFFYIGEKFSTISDCVYSSETDTGEDVHCHVHQRRTLFRFFPRNHSRSLVFTKKIGDICCVLKAVKRSGLSCAKSGNKGSSPYPCCPKCSFSQCVFIIIWGYFLKKKTALTLTREVIRDMPLGDAAERDRSSLEVLTYEGFQFARGTCNSSWYVFAAVLCSVCFTRKSEACCVHACILFCRCYFQAQQHLKGHSVFVSLSFFVGG